MPPPENSLRLLPKAIFIVDQPLYNMLNYTFNNIIKAYMNPVRPLKVHYLRGETLVVAENIGIPEKTLKNS